MSVATLDRAQIILIGFKEHIKTFKEHLVEMEKENMEIRIKNAEQNHMVKIEKTDDVLWWEQKLQDKKNLVETLEAQHKTRENHFNQVLLSNDIKLKLVQDELKSKEEELATFKQFVKNLPGVMNVKEEA